MCADLYIFSHHCYYYYIYNKFMYFELDNDDMDSSKCRSIFISVVFILKCFTKPFIIVNYFDSFSPKATD